MKCTPQCLARAQHLEAALVVGADTWVRGSREKASCPFLTFPQVQPQAGSKARPAARQAGAAGGLLLAASAPRQAGGVPDRSREPSTPLLPTGTPAFPARSLGLGSDLKIQVSCVHRPQDTPRRPGG